MKNTNTSSNSIVERIHTLWMLPFFIFALSFVSPAHAASNKKIAKVNSKLTKIAKNKAIKPVAKKVILPAKSPRQAAMQRAPAQRGPASLSAGISDSQKSLEIRGQSRNLSMLLVLKNRHENIDFVKPRETYREEIPQTEF
ncbi:MAG: hypothetical protein ACXWRE_01465 [Pseudobdellovibrionaceae bacterium]